MINCAVEVTALAYAFLELHELEASRRIRENAETRGEFKAAHS